MIHKRPVRLQELRLIVMEHDTTEGGNFKEGFEFHIGRLAHPNSKVIAMACNIEGDMKWQYYANTFMFSRIPICQECYETAIDQLHEADKAMLEGLFTPSL